MSHQKPNHNINSTARDRENVRRAENQVVFRRLNQELGIFIDEIKSIPLERGAKPHKFNKFHTYYFFCECSDENCNKRILITFAAYEKAHVRNDTFVLSPGHALLDIEEVIVEKPTYCIVKKFKTPRQSVKNLQPTSFTA